MSRRYPVPRSFAAFLAERAADHELRPAAFVLAGGQSSRMGRDKALIPFDGRPLILRALEILRETGLTPSIAGARASLQSFAPVIADSEDGLGPLGGICAALEVMPTQARWAVFIPVDLPLLPSALVAWLLWRAEVTQHPITVPSVSGFAQTFPAVIDRDAFPVLEAELKAGRLGCFSAFRAAAVGLAKQIDIVPIELLVQSGQIADPGGLPVCRWFLNVNAPEDLRFTEELYRHPIA